MKINEDVDTRPLVITNYQVNLICFYNIIKISSLLERTTADNSELITDTYYYYYYRPRLFNLSIDKNNFHNL